MSDLLSALHRQLRQTDEDYSAPWMDDPVVFATECIVWPKDKQLTVYQADVLSHLAANRRAAVRGPHGLGKTTTAAIAVHWWALRCEAQKVDWKVVTTAGGWRQLEHFLWPEIHLWARRINWEMIGRRPYDETTELLKRHIQLRHGEAFPVASTQPALIEGAHASRILYIYDESKAILPATWDAAEGAFSTGEAYALAISTPGEPEGRFYDIHVRKPGYEDWWVRHVTKEEVIAAGQMTLDWADQRARQWGADSAVYKNRVLGEFAASDEDSLIPLAWVEAANDRWDALMDSKRDIGPMTDLGVDVARAGGDETVLALRHGEVVRELRCFAIGDTMATVGHVVAALRAAPRARPVVDVIGVGAGVVDRLREGGVGNTVAFNASAGTRWRDRTGELQFYNLRSASWWHMRELLDPSAGATVALPRDDMLTGDLTAPHYKITSTGKIQVESKDEIRAKIDRSTDRGDAVVMSFWGDEEPDWLSAYGLGECRKCATIVPDGSKVCPQCGEPYEATVIAATVDDPGEDNPWLFVYAGGKEEDPRRRLERLRRLAEAAVKPR